MVPKRPREVLDDDQEPSPSKRGPYSDSLVARAPLSSGSTSSSTPNATFSSKAAGKQKRSLEDNDLDKWESIPSSLRQQPIARSTQERFVPGLQTLVGGLQMSQSSSSTLSVPTASRNTPSTRLRRSLGPSEAIQPLMMSRSSETERRASQSSAQQRSHASSSLQVSATILADDPPQVPGVSPGWHVEAHGRQAMELQDGVRHEDEDGWTPLDVFPAATPQGKLVAHRARLRSRAPPIVQQQDSALPLSLAEDKALSLLTSTESFPTSACTSPDIQMLTAPDTASEDLHEKVDLLGGTTPPEQVGSKPPNYSLQDFEVIETLGTGTFGRVLLVRLKGRDVTDRSAYFALKVLAKTDVVRLKQVSHVNSEREILGKVQHPFVVNQEATFQDSRNCYMLLEYVVGGEVFSYLRRAGSFSADVARFYVSTIVLAIEHLHNRNIIYRDLKPENLLIDSSGYTKITDFGFAKQVDERTWTLCGTPEYLAPEIIQCSGHGKAVDWWSLGILLFEMLAGHPPFCDPNPLNVYEKILQGNVIFPEHIDPVSRHLISSLLNSDRSKRLGNLRGGAQDVKNHAWFHGVDWRSLEQRRIRPPIIPYLGEAGDTSNFSKYNAPRPSQLPGLFGLEPTDISKLNDEFGNLFVAF